MAKVNSQRGGCIDVFHAELLREAKYDGEFDFPIIKEEHIRPRSLITFSRAMREKVDFRQWVCFYEDDFQFERIWNNPQRYVRQLSKFEGIITPDFSVYYDFPLSMQIWNIFRSRAIGAWFQKQGFHVIPNIRFGDERTFECCCCGVSKHSVVAIGTLGCMQNKDYRYVFEQGIEYVADNLMPEVMIFYGAAPKNINKIKKKGIGVSRRERLLEKAQNEKLRNALKELYHKGSFIGDGGTASALKFEKRTGISMGRKGNSHYQKAVDMTKYISNKVLKESLKPSERKMAEKILKQLKKAMAEWREQ